MSNKRERELRVQAWFDPENPDEKPVADIVEKLRAVEGLKDKAILYYALVALGQRDFPELVGGLSDRNAQISVRALASLDKLAQLIDTLPSLLLNTPANQGTRQLADAVHDLQNEFGQLDALESGVASRYQSFKFDEEEESN